ncbi:MAG: hypothetical protein Q8L81_16590 [Bacteroidota bacterium]|nr:hypothetical protein [Bacteroidota bacterium]
MNSKIILHYLCHEHKETKKISEYKFSNEFNFKLENNIILISRNNLFIKDFYGKQISNLSIVVGSNGAGKTNLCYTLVDFIDNQKNYSLSNLIYIYSIGDKLFGYKSTDYQFDPASLKFESINLSKHLSLNHLNFKSVFLTFVFNYASERLFDVPINYSHYINLSTTYLLKRSIIGNAYVDPANLHEYNRIPLNTALKHFKFNEFNNMVQVTDYEDLFETYKVKVPQYLKINLSVDLETGKQKEFRIGNDKSKQNQKSKKTPLYKRRIIEDHIDRIEEKVDKINLYFGKINYEQLTFKSKFKLKINNRFIHSLIKNYGILHIPDQEIQDNVEHEVNQIISSYEQNLLNEDYIKELYLTKHSNQQTKDVLDSLYLKYYYELNETINELISHDTLGESFENNDFLFIQLKETKDIVKKLKTQLFKDNKLYKPLHLELSHADTQSGLSSGETTLLSTFGRLLTMDLQNLPSNLLLMIDEADLTLHPHWQKKYINSLMVFLNDILPKVWFQKFNKSDTHIQLIITTHSPILLSDVIENSVLYLNSPNKPIHSTFSQNIHELFNNEFILETGIIGDYAQSKINEIITEIQEDKPMSLTRFSEILLTIKNIAEPFIQFKLMELLERKSTKANNELLKTERESLVKKQIDKLKKLLPEQHDQN